MNRFAFVLTSRGFVNSLHRTSTLFQRFDFHGHFLKNNLRQLGRIAKEHGFRASLPVSTVLLERYKDLAPLLREEGFDVLSHGYLHVDHAALPPMREREFLVRSKDILISNGFSPTGFRAPYLHHSKNTWDALVESGFQFDSSAVFWGADADSLGIEKGPSRDHFDRAKKFYQPFETPIPAHGRPYWVKGNLLQIPVSLPDDEILMDRLGYRDPTQVLRVWLTLLKKSVCNEGLFTLQLHPERVGLLSEILDTLFAEVSRHTPPIWRASLSEINEWWRERHDFRLHWTWDKNRAVVHSLKSDRVALFWSVPAQTEGPSLSPKSLHWEGPWEGDRVPIVGVHPQAQQVEPLLEQRGFLFKRTEDLTPFALRVEAGTVHEQLVNILQTSSVPLLRLGFWPRGYHSGFCVSGDIDCITLQDFAYRFFERGNR